MQQSELAHLKMNFPTTKFESKKILDFQFKFNTNRENKIDTIQFFSQRHKIHLPINKILTNPIPNHKEP
jgi:hypothetical protein